MQDNKKENIYQIDDKYYAKKVKNATCNKKVNGVYFLKCEIKMRGINDYKYKLGTNYLIKDTYRQDDFKTKNILYLEEAALNTILNAISIMDRYIEIVNNKGYKAKDNILYYDRKDNNIYSFIYKYVDGDNISYYYKEGNIFRNNFHDRKTREDLMNESFCYQAAKYYNDEIFMLELLVRENLATNEECIRLSELTGRTILPKADIKYNKTFVVNRDGIDADVLYQSGYRILHRPYFAMKGSTHDKWELNPYNKTVVDATLKDNEGISFEEYILIINEKNLVFLLQSNNITREFKKSGAS